MPSNNWPVRGPDNPIPILLPHLSPKCTRIDDRRDDDSFVFVRVVLVDFDFVVAVAAVDEIFYTNLDRMVFVTYPV